MSTKQNPPSWCSDAVATSKGWCHPKTGEILISKAGLIVDAPAAEKEADAPKKAAAPKAKKVLPPPEPVEVPVATVTPDDVPVETKAAGPEENEE